MEDKIMKLINGASIIGLVQQTYDYSLFKFHPKNRKIRRDKVDKIKISMTLRDILNPILVNENMEIGEGQHRFTAKKELGLPITFIVVEGLDVEAMQILNQNETKSNWTHEDYLEMYIKENKSHYITFHELITKYELNFIDLLHIIDELSKVPVGEREMAIQFDEGNFVIGNIDTVIDFLEELSLFDRYDFCRHTSFVRAFLTLYTEEFYDKEYIRHRIDICDIKLKKEGRKGTIVEYKSFIADEFYSSGNGNGMVIIYHKSTDTFHTLDSKRGRKLKN